MNIKPGSLCYLVNLNDNPQLNGRVCIAERYVGLFERAIKNGRRLWFWLPMTIVVSHAWRCTLVHMPGMEFYVNAAHLRPITDPDEPPTVDDEIEGLDDELRRVIEHARPV